MNLNPSERKKTISYIVIFSLLVTTLAFISPLLGGSPSDPGLGFIIWGTAPMLVAILLRLVTRDWTDAGLRPALRKNTVWYIISILAYPVLMTLTLLLGTIFSVSSISDFSMLSYVKTALTALPIFLIFAFFEEFGWRGYLVPKLASIKINDYLMHAVVALVWATWHLPFIKELSWVYTSEDLLTFIPRLYLGAFAFSLFYNEIRLITGTIWPAVLMHAISNSFGHPLAAEYVIFAPDKAYLGSIGFDGFFMIAFFVVLGIGLNRWRLKKFTPSESLA